VWEGNSRVDGGGGGGGGGVLYSTPWATISETSSL